MSHSDSAKTRPIVLEVGLLIDGSGAEPMRDAVVVVEGKRVTAVGKRKEIPVPKNAQIIRLKNKTALPGLIDAHAHYQDWHSEIYLNYGVTTAISTAGSLLPWSLVQKEGIEKGKILGPRLLTTGRLDVPGPSGEATAGSVVIVQTPEEGRAEVRKFIEMGVDYIKARDNMSGDIMRAVVEEAHRGGKIVTTHTVNGIEAVLDDIDVDSIEHYHSVILGTVKDREQRWKLELARRGSRMRGGGLTSVEVLAFAEEAQYDRIIEAMVSKRVYWTPTIADWRAFSPGRNRFKREEAKLFSLPGLRYMPRSWLDKNEYYFSGTANLDSELRSRIELGYRKLKDFLRRFVEAGGKVRTGSDPHNLLPAYTVHRELELFVEAGLTPMQAILAATKNTAERIGRERDFGQIAPGTFADIVIVDGNPLKNISDTRKIRMVFKEGRPVKLGFHPSYRNPIPETRVQGGAPRIESISPQVVAQGDGPVTLSVKGRNFLTSAVVKFNGTSLPTKAKFDPERYPSSQRTSKELTATANPKLISRPGTYAIVVEHPRTNGPTVKVVSNAEYLMVKFK